MSDALTAAAERLGALLRRENAALTALDLPGATALLKEKEAAAQALLAAQEANRTPAPAAIAVRLRDLAQENRRLLERAIAVQGQVIGLIAGALPRSAGPVGYAASGAPAWERQPIAFTLSARA